MDIHEAPIPTDQLIDKGYYLGKSYHTRVARWDGNTNTFLFWETRRGIPMLEVIEHIGEDQPSFYSNKFTPTMLIPPEDVIQIIPIDPLEHVPFSIDDYNAWLEIYQKPV